MRCSGYMVLGVVLPCLACLASPPLHPDKQFFVGPENFK